MKRGFFFLSGANCIELLDPVAPKGTTAYCIDTLPEMVPLYGPDGMLFVKTEEPSVLSMMVKMYAESGEKIKSRRSKRE